VAQDDNGISRRDFAVRVGAAAAGLVKHDLVFDGRTELFFGDKKADELLTREYRKGFELPGSSS
jgi:hypothetical protein